MFYLTTHLTHFIYGYMASDIWLRTILIVRKETHCRHIGYSFRLAARVLLYAPSQRQDSTYHSLCYTSCGALAGTRPNDPSHHERTLLPWRYISLPSKKNSYNPPPNPYINNKLIYAGHCVRYTKNIYFKACNNNNNNNPLPHKKIKMKK